METGSSTTKAPSRSPRFRSGLASSEPGSSAWSSAAVWGRLGSEVTILEALDDFLPAADRRIRERGVEGAHPAGGSTSGSGARVTGARPHDGGGHGRLRGRQRAARMRVRPARRRGGTAREHRGARAVPSGRRRARRSRPHRRRWTLPHWRGRHLGDRRRGGGSDARAQGVGGRRRGRGTHRGTGRAHGPRPHSLGHLHPPGDRVGRSDRGPSWTPPASRTGPVPSPSSPAVAPRARGRTDGRGQGDRGCRHRPHPRRPRVRGERIGADRRGGGRDGLRRERRGHGAHHPRPPHPRRGDARSRPGGGRAGPFTFERTAEDTQSFPAAGRTTGFGTAPLGGTDAPETAGRGRSPGSTVGSYR